MICCNIVHNFGQISKNFSKFRVNEFKVEKSKNSAIKCPWKWSYFCFCWNLPQPFWMIKKNFQKKNQQKSKLEEKKNQTQPNNVNRKEEHKTPKQCVCDTIFTLFTRWFFIWRPLQVVIEFFGYFYMTVSLFWKKKFYFDWKMFAINQNYDSIDGELVRKAKKSLLSWMNFYICFD